MTDSVVLVIVNALLGLLHANKSLVFKYKRHRDFSDLGLGQRKVGNHWFERNILFISISYVEYFSQVSWKWNSYIDTEI